MASSTGRALSFQFKSSKKENSLVPSPQPQVLNHISLALTGSFALLSLCGQQDRCPDWPDQSPVTIPGPGVRGHVSSDKGEGNDALQEKWLLFQKEREWIFEVKNNSGNYLSLSPFKPKSKLIYVVKIQRFQW